MTRAFYYGRVCIAWTRHTGFEVDYRQHPNGIRIIAARVLILHLSFLIRMRNRDWKNNRSPSRSFRIGLPHNILGMTWYNESIGCWLPRFNRRPSFDAKSLNGMLKQIERLGKEISQITEPRGTYVNVSTSI